MTAFDKFLSTPSARRATALCRTKEPPFRISIHALREEGDVGMVLNAGRLFKISIHALREEGDINRGNIMAVSANFYPRPPRGGRLLHATMPKQEEIISIHALREEGDSRRICRRCSP